MNIYDKDHPHNDVFVLHLQSLIEGKPRAIDYRKNDSQEWRTMEVHPDGFCPTSWYEKGQYRLTPATVTRTITYPEPMRVSPKLNSAYWVISHNQESGVDKSRWVNDSVDKLRLGYGMAFATEADAKAAAKAIFGIEE